MLKFILGPVGGFAMGLNPIVTVLATVGGMMTSVILFTFFGRLLRPKIMRILPKRKKKLFRRRRQFVIFWKKYGTLGIAMLTPLLLTPIGGTILVVSLGAPRNKTLLYMLISGLCWSIVLTTAVYIFGQHAFSLFM